MSRPLLELCGRLLPAHASPLTPQVPEKQLNPAMLEVLFFSSLVQLKVVLEEPRVEDLRHQCWVTPFLSRFLP